MEVETITREVDTETRLERAFERMIEIKYQKNLLEQEELQIKDDAFDYLIGIAHTTSGRFVANDLTAEVYVSYRSQREYNAEELEKIKPLEEHLSHVKHPFAAASGDIYSCIWIPLHSAMTAGLIWCKKRSEEPALRMVSVIFPLHCHTCLQHLIQLYQHHSKTCHTLIISRRPH